MSATIKEFILAAEYIAMREIKTLCVNVAKTYGTKTKIPGYFIIPIIKNKTTDCC